MGRPRIGAAAPVNVKHLGRPLLLLATAAARRTAG
jgi:hypothetical protein